MSNNLVRPTVVASNAESLGNWIIQWGESIQEKTEETLNEIKIKGRDVAKKSLLQAYHTQKQGDLLVDDIVVQGDYIIAGRGETIESMYYAEYGAGKVSVEHPEAKQFGWEYDIKNHGDSGWWYKTTIYDKNPKKIEYDNGSIYGWTKSSRPAKFMYKTGQWIENNATKILERKMKGVKK